MVRGVVRGWMVRDLAVSSVRQHVCADSTLTTARFVPETKDLTLEKLDEVFSLSTSKHMAHGVRQLIYCVKRYVLWQKSAKKPILFEIHEQADGYELSDAESHTEPSERRLSSEEDR